MHPKTALGVDITTSFLKVRFWLQVVRWGRSIYVNIQKFIQFQTTVNGVALLLNFITALASGEAPLTAVQVCLNFTWLLIFFNRYWLDI